MNLVINDCLGIPVRYDPEAKVIADSRGLLRWKEIVVGPGIFNFSRREQQAILLHEVGHCKLYHLEKRLLRLWKLIWPKSLALYCQFQEQQADYYVAQCGYGLDLASAFSRMTSSGGPLHPSTSSRIERLLAWHSKA
jgi:Zn-dependent protease with chaperone function